MTVKLHIERIVIEGASLTRRQREHLLRTLEQELARQLSAPAPGESAAGAPRGGRSPQETGPAALGARIAGEVAAALPGLKQARPPARAQAVAP